MVIHFGTNRFLIYDFLQAVNSNFCSAIHRLAINLNVTNDRQTVLETVRTVGWITALNRGCRRK